MKVRLEVKFDSDVISICLHEKARDNIREILDFLKFFGWFGS